MARILVVDDEPKMTSLICGALEDEGHSVTTTIKPAEALELIAKHAFDIVVTDLSMPEISGMEILKAALEKGGSEIVLMTAYGTVETAVAAMKQGAADYLTKPFALDELVLLIEKLVAGQKVASLSSHYAAVIRGSVSAEFIGTSPAAKALGQLIAKVAPTGATVLLMGKSGTGKELAARMIHDLSPRREQPFIAVNCAAITETLLESELFGHEKGSFTGAVGLKRGRFELAEKGTIFLDEIGEMSMGMQSKLLRVIEDRRVVRVGGVDTIDIDVRVVAATNRDLKEEVAAGGFREDLFFRLNVFPVMLPSLSERGADVIALAEYFLASQNFPHRVLSEEVKELFLRYDWPGNVRELRNVLERAVILSGGEPLTVEEFSLTVDDAPLVASEGRHPEPARGLEGTEREMILGALEKAGGNKTEAARFLRISRRRLYSRMKVHGIKP